MHEILATTRHRLPDLADYLEDCCETPLFFEGDDPNKHSSDNHIHLFPLIAHMEQNRWIDAAYMTAFAECILTCWHARLKGMAPYRQQGYRLYLYEDMAPTMSAVAETPEGFPYPGTPTFVDSPAEIMRLYKDFKLSEAFSPAGLRRKDILDAIERHKGSISKPTAQALGLKVGELRKAVELWGITDEVNAIRKRYHRRPARLRSNYESPFFFKVYERRLPPRY